VAWLRAKICKREARMSRGQRVESKLNVTGMRLYKVSTTLEVCFLGPEQIQPTDAEVLKYRAGEAICAEIRANEPDDTYTITEITDAVAIPPDWLQSYPWGVDAALILPIETVLDWINEAQKP
jgi:hypothetical protein